MNAALRIQIMADARQARKQLNELDKRIGRLKTSMRTLSAASREVASTTNQVSRAQAQAAKRAAQVTKAQNDAAASAARLAAAEERTKQASIKSARDSAAASAKASLDADRAINNRLGARQKRVAALAAAERKAAAQAAANAQKAAQQQAAAAARLTAAEARAHAIRVAAAEKAAAAKSAAEAKVATQAQLDAARVSTAQAKAAASQQVAQNQVISSARRAGIAQNQLATSASRAEVAQNAAAASAIRLSMAYARVAAASRGAGVALRDFGARIVKSGKDTQWLGRILTTSFTLPVLLAAGAGTKWALEYERGMVRIQKVYNGATSDIEQFRRGFRALSDIFGIHIEEIAEIGAAWAQAGAEGEQLMLATRATVEAMLLGDLDSETAITGLLTVMAAFKLESSQLTEVLAYLNKVENETAVSMGDLLTVLGKTAGTARESGVSIRELAAMTASLVPIAGTASEAGRALKTIIPRVMSPRTVQAKDAFRALGIEVNSVGYHSKTLTQRLEGLSDGWANATQQQKINFSSYVFGNQQISRGITLLTDLFEANGRYADAMTATADRQEVMNTYQKEMAILLQSSPKAFDIMTNRLRNLLIEGFLPMLPALVDFMTLLVKLAYSFQDLDPFIQRLVIGFIALLAVAGPLMSVIGLLGILIGTPIKAIGQLALAMAKLTGYTLSSVVTLGLLAGVVFVLTYALTGGGIQGALWGLAAAVFAVGLATGSTALLIGGLIFAAIALGYSLGGAEGALWGLAIAAAAVAIAFGGIPLIIAAVVLVLAALAYTIYTHWDSIGPKVHAVMGAMVEAVKAGAGAIPKIFSAALSATIRIIARAIEIIWDLLSYLNPFATHSPSLVSQVQDGTAVITNEYANMAGSVTRSLGQTTSAIANLTRAMAGAKAAAEATELSEGIELAGLAGVNAGTYVAAFNAVKAMRVQLDGMSAAVKAQEAVVEGWKDQLDQANDVLDQATEKLRALEQVVSDIDDEIKASQDRLSDWLSAPITGTYAFEDAIFANQQDQKALQLEMAKIEQKFYDAGTSIEEVRQAMEEQAEAASDLAEANDGVSDSLNFAGLSAEDARSRMARLAAEIEGLRGEEFDLRMAGAGSDVLAGIQGEISAAEKARRALSQIAGDGESDGGLPPPADLADLVDAFDELEAKLDSLRNQGDILDLEQALALEPARKAIEDTQRVAEQSFEAILAGIASEMAAQVELNKQREVAVAAVDAQKVAVEQLTVARDAIQASYDAEQESLSKLQAAYSDLQQSLSDAESALSEVISLGQDIKKAMEEAAAAAEDAADALGDFDLPEGGGLGAELFDPEGLDALVDDWVAEAEKSFNDAWDKLKERIQNKWNEFWGDGPMEWLKMKFRELWQWIKDDAQLSWDQFIGFLDRTWQIIKATIVFTWEGIKAFFAETWQRIKDDAQLSWDQFTGFLSSTWQLIKATIVLTWEGIKAFFAEIWQRIKADAQLSWDQFTGFLSRTWSTIRTTAETAWNGIKGVFTRITDWLQTTWQSGWTRARDGIVDTFRALPGMLGSAMSRIGSYMASPINAAIGIVNTFARGVNWVANKLGLGFSIPLIGSVSAGGGGGSTVTQMASGGLVPESEVGGGFVTNRARAIVGEGSKSHPEFVIPTDPQHRGRAQMLASQLLGKIGMAKGGEVPQYATGGVLGMDTLQWLINQALNTGIAAHNKMVGAVDTARAGMSHLGGFVGQMGRAVLEKIIDKVWDMTQRWIKNFMSTGSASGGETLQSRAVSRSTGGGGGSSFMASGGVVPIHQMANGGLIKGGRGGAFFQGGERGYDEVVLPLGGPSAQRAMDSVLSPLDGSSGGRVLNFYGDLVFPNMTDGDDIEDFLANLEAAAA